MQQPADAARALRVGDGAANDAAVPPIGEPQQQPRQPVEPVHRHRREVECPRRVVPPDRAIGADQLGEPPPPRAEDSDGVAQTIRRRVGNCRHSVTRLPRSRRCAAAVAQSAAGTIQGRSAVCGRS